MKKNLLILLLTITSLCYGQTHARKTRSDKGKKHSHTTSYYAKKAIKPKSTTKTSSKKKK